MKATVSKRDLLRVLGHAASVAEMKSTMPMLRNVLLTVDRTTLIMVATDLYMALHGGVSVDGAAPGSVAVSAKDLHDRVRVLPDGPIHLSVNEQRSLTLKAGGASRKFTLHGANGEDYPPLHGPDKSAAFHKLPAATIVALINKCRPAISTDETRAHLNSALFEWDGSLVRLVSTDGHRLHKAEATIAGSSGSVTMLIPLKALSMVSALCDLAAAEAGGDAAADVEFSVAGPQAFFKVAGLTFSAKLTDAVFPPYAQVIPKASARTVTVGRAALADAVKSVALASSDRTGGVKFSFGGKAVRVMAESPDGGDGYDEVPVETNNGDQFVVGVSARYVLDVLGAVDSDEVLLGLHGELDPMTVRPSGNDSDTFLAVIMPMRV